MEFNNIDWADSNIDRIEIEYDCAKLFVFNDTLQMQYYSQSHRDIFLC